MIYLESDYMRGGHPDVMRALLETNMEAIPGYGEDAHTERARKLILDACGLSEEGDVRFLVGGTQTNATMIDALLHPCEGVIAAETSHINVHEAGAIEAFGHKVLTLPATYGKLSATDIDEYLNRFYEDQTWPHMVIPGMVYISQPTELGTLYTLEELESISLKCSLHNLRLYVDGARLAYALASPENDVTLRDLARLCDAFYIGGTKCGALFGEAVVLPHRETARHLFTQIKRHGALFAKGWLIARQFEVLFSNGLYEEIGKRGNEQAMKIKKIMKTCGHKQYVDSSTNQQFFIVPNRVADRMKREVAFSIWERVGGRHTVVRFVTDWATKINPFDFIRFL
ncbi:MAG: threonine aldolase family protein [Lepagella sp.]